METTNKYMKNLTQIELKAPYLIFIGSVSDPLLAKTGFGLVQWSPEKVGGQFRFEGNTLDLGVPDMTIQQAVEAGVKSIVIGVAPPGGSVDDGWLSVLTEAAHAGLDVASGLHMKLEGFSDLQRVANASGAKLVDVRIPSARVPVGTGKKRSGKRVLMVGTDCAVGKKYTALSLTKCMNNLGLKASFRATGQTGIMISGSGIPVDAVVADFISGAAEQVSPDNESDHWDVIEGQGSLYNPSYAGVSLGLLHGSQPDAIVVCHEANRAMVSSCPDIPLPSLQECIDLNLRCARVTNPEVVCVGVSVNTSGLIESDRQSYLQRLSRETGLPCVDSMVEGCDDIARELLSTCVHTPVIGRSA